MTIYINDVDGSVLEYCGLEDHRTPEDILYELEYDIYPDVPIPSGDYGTGRKFCVRLQGRFYYEGDYDVAVIE